MKVCSMTILVLRQKVPSLLKKVIREHAEMVKELNQDQENSQGPQPPHKIIVVKNMCVCIYVFTPTLGC